MDTYPLSVRPKAWVLVCAGLLAARAQADQGATSPAALRDGPFIENVAQVDASSAGPSATQDNADVPWSPRKSANYVGLSLGSARFNMPCIDGMVCKRSGKALTFYAGGEFSQRWGFELAYMRMSNMEHAGNALRVKGLSASLLGELPLTPSCRLIGRVGTNYAWTRVDQSINPAQPTGSAHGLGLSLGGGINWDFAQRWTATAEWNRHDFKFVTGRDTVDAATVGMRYRY
jgi:OOP family OmpA-OmpF porin